MPLLCSACCTSRTAGSPADWLPCIDPPCCDDCMPLLLLELSLLALLLLELPLLPGGMLPLVLPLCAEAPVKAAAAATARVSCRSVMGSSLER